MTKFDRRAGILTRSMRSSTELFSPDQGDLSVLHFRCPQCDKSLRVDEDKAGAPVKCPGCGSRFRVPENEEESEPPKMKELEPQTEGLYEDEEPQRPRKKKKRSGGSEAAARGKTIVIVMICLVVVVNLLGLIGAFLAPSPEEALKQLGATNQNQAQTPQQKAQEESLKNTMEMGAKIGRVLGFVLLFGWFAAEVLVLVFLYLGHNWARITFAVLSLIGALCGFAAVAGLFMAPPHGLHGAVNLLSVVLGEAVNWGNGITLLVSASIKAHTSGR
jgi:predicted Zn finger-like uncharacterized protein